ncbi:hypothetical protein PRIC1_009892 [Phytophthora ramorum]
MSSMKTPRLEASPAAAARGSISDGDQDAAAHSDVELEDEDTAPSDSEDEGSSHSRRRQRIHFDVQQLQTVYHLPLKTAAERLGVCEAALKRICRRNRIHKWPYRQLSSVRRRIADLKERRAASLLEERGVEGPEVSDSLSSLMAEAFDVSLQQLEEEQARIIQSAHQPRRPRKTIQCQATNQRQRPETLAGHVHCFRSKIADLPPLDLRRVDRDFPLLFLANVCESVRAYH